jgi:hypothetical protein
MQILDHNFGFVRKTSLFSRKIGEDSFFLSPSLSGPTHQLRWVVQTDVAFYFMLGAQQQA